jgi:hypothetical protein
MEPTALTEDELDAYFRYMRYLARETRRLLADHKPIPKRPLHQDSALHQWLTNTILYEQDGAERAWPIVLRLVARAPDDFALCFIGSGHLEDLLRTAGPELAARADERARIDPRFRVALACVWPASADQTSTDIPAR